jgi:hypothetical protein
MAIASDLQRYLQVSRDSVLSSLDGLPEYDMRRPMTPTGTNLLGVVKHPVPPFGMRSANRSPGRAGIPDEAFL